MSERKRGEAAEKKLDELAEVVERKREEYEAAMQALKQARADELQQRLRVEETKNRFRSDIRSCDDNVHSSTAEESDGGDEAAAPEEESGATASWPAAPGDHETQSNEGGESPARSVRREKDDAYEL